MKNKTYNRRKILIVFSIATILLLGLIGRLAYLMIFEAEYYQKKADKLTAPYKFEESRYVGCTASLFNSKKNRHEKSLYAESVMLDFEDKKFKAPVGYHEILTVMYGDYMKLPPAEQQVTHHLNKTFFKDGTENEEV